VPVFRDLSKIGNNKELFELIANILPEFYLNDNEKLNSRNRTIN